MKKPGSVFVNVATRDGDLVEGAWLNPIDAIHSLQAAIDTLRLRTASPFDPSWGEQPPAVLAPRETEIAPAH